MRALLRGLALAALAPAALFALAFHDRYWRHRDCFNELGRCWDPVEEQVYVEGAGMVWGGLTGLCLLVAAVLLLLSRRARA